MKLNEKYKLQFCKLMCNTKTGFDVKRNIFTLASSVHSNNTRFSKNFNLSTERHRTRLGLNCFKYLGPKFWSSVLETYKNSKKIVLNINYFCKITTSSRARVL